MTRLRVLASAFTCCPPGNPGFTGGESLLGWNMLNQIARYQDVWVLTQEVDRTNIEQAPPESFSENIHFEYVGLPSFLNSLLRIQGGHQIYYYLWQIKASFIAKKLNKERPFDLFHHVTYGNDWMASFIGARVPIPYVRGPGGGSHRTPESLQSEYPLAGRIWEKFRSIGQWLFRHDPFFIASHNRASAILLCNQDSIDSLPEKWKHKVHVFPVCGVSTEDLNWATEARSEHDYFKVISAGSLIRIKGFGLTIKSFKEFSDSHPNCQLTIYGSGPEEPRLRKLIEQTQLQDKVKLAGPVPRNELLDQIASSDVFLFPSLRDGGGMVVIEAMSLGRPVICLNIGGPGMIITDDCGVKITPGSPKTTVHDLAAALERLYLDCDLRNLMGKAARDRVEETYHWDKLGDSLNLIYKTTMGAESND